MSVRVKYTLTKYTTFLTPDNSINMALINDALAKIESPEPGKKFSYIKIAYKYGVGRSTLTQRHKAETRLREEYAIIRVAVGLGLHGPWARVGVGSSKSRGKVRLGLGYIG